MRAYFWYDFITPTTMTDEDRAKLAEFGYDGPLEILQGEDFYFCDRVKVIGGSIYVDPRIELTHFDGCVQHNASLKHVRFEAM